MKLFYDDYSRLDLSLRSLHLMFLRIKQINYFLIQTLCWMVDPILGPMHPVHRLPIYLP